VPAGACAQGHNAGTGCHKDIQLLKLVQKKKKKKNPHQIHVLMTLAEMLQVSGFPTIMFVSGKDGSVISYDGNRQQEDMIKFINEHSSGLSPKSASKDEL